MGQTVAEIREMLQSADAARFAVLERSLVADTRKGVRSAVEVARRRLQAQAAEEERLSSMFSFQRQIALEHGGGVVLGLDEVGRGPLAGPLAVGGVVLPDECRIPLLNDSKQLTAQQREDIAAQVRQQAVAWTVRYVEPGDIDAHGIMASLKRAFRAAIAEIEAQGVHVGVVLLDGNPLHLDPREVNVVKGDARCASIAAASVVAKVERDALMDRLDERYPGYGFAKNKGYGSAEHTEAIKRLGLSAVHRASFCTSFTQESLF